MRIEHIALSTKHLEEMREFYKTYFHVTSNDKYTNEKKGFESYFLTFSDGARIEIMKQSQVYQKKKADRQLGYCHLAISVGSTLMVEELTMKMEQDGIEIVSYPRFTGDGYYESIVRDPDGNRIEITV